MAPHFNIAARRFDTRINLLILFQISQSGRYFEKPRPLLYQSYVSTVALSTSRFSLLACEAARFIRNELNYSISGWNFWYALCAPTSVFADVLKLYDQQRKMSAAWKHFYQKHRTKIWRKAESAPLRSHDGFVLGVVFFFFPLRFGGWQIWRLYISTSHPVLLHGTVVCTSVCVCVCCIQYTELHWNDPERWIRLVARSERVSSFECGVCACRCCVMMLDCTWCVKLTACSSFCAVGLSLTDLYCLISNLISNLASFSGVSRD